MRIVSLCGALGYGYSVDSFNRALEQKVDVIAVDGGSSDPGPHYLGSAKTGFTRESLKRDLEIAILAALERKVPFILGSSGLAGGEPHLEVIRQIVYEIAEENNLDFMLALIHTELDKEYLKDKLRNGKVIPLGDQIELTQDSIEGSVRIVGQIGTEPFIEAYKSGADVILAGRACDSAIFASIPISRGYAPGLAFHMAKIIECGTLCAYPSGNDVVTADIYDDHFVLEPGGLDRKCTVERVAAHTLYEQKTPLHIIEPEGVANLAESQYEQLTDRAVKVSDSTFTPAEKKTVKIEGAILAGYRTICMGGSNESLFIESLEDIAAATKKSVAEKVAGNVAPDDYSLNIRVYGGATNGAKVIDIAAAQVGVVIDVVGKSQHIADYVCATARGVLMHLDYAGRKSTAGNIAFPYSPSEHSLGPVYEFSAYHLIEVDDFSEAYTIEYRHVGGESQ
jgi:hypothetical protein